ncbi:hypothetical protein [Fodinicola acaciae]|uniref:hypothetical protein n=1 Tax=Fodinicola acaciae TaxID=2681555 RepID=UPI0013D89875|nr:hypothetical protein [Fodinicola acaciae]
MVKRVLGAVVVGGLLLAGLLSGCGLAPEPRPSGSPHSTAIPTVPPSSQIPGGQAWWPYVVFGVIVLVLILIGVALATAPKRPKPPRP